MLSNLNQNFDTETINFQKLNLGPYSNNVYILTCKKSKKSIIIDTSHSSKDILSACKGTEVQFILQTHCHGDHIDALDEVREITGVPLGLHKKDKEEFGITSDFELKDGEFVSFGDVSIKCVHTPGHSKGMTMFYFPGHCICGDTIFPGGPGKTWSHEQLLQLLKSIKEKVLTLPKETILYPGHGENTTVAKSKILVSKYELNGNPQKEDFGDITWE